MFFDTGVLYAAARRREFLQRLATYYGERLHVAEQVLREVERRASPRTETDGRLRTVASTVKTALVDAGLITQAPLLEEDVPAFDDITRQLANGPSSGDDVHPNQHSGEAATIAISKRRGSHDKVVFYTNDTGASIVAEAHGVHSAHFGHILNELVCHGVYTAEEAFELFEFAQPVTGVAMGYRPADAGDLRCVIVDSVCRACDMIP